MMEVGELRDLDGIRTNFGIADGKQILLHGVSQEKDPYLKPFKLASKGL
jgi:hypothetical protein